jgi:Thermostable 8-oxoguanine DNA glycosylase
MYSSFAIEKENSIEEIKKIYRTMQDEIVSRLDEFKGIWKDGSEESVFAELVFCILTPQSKARLCWAAVENLMNKKLLLRGDKNQIIRELNGVRFKYKKAEYIVEARRQYSIDGKIAIKPRIDQFTDVYDAREWLVENVKGIGYKEASHFLRNIGLGENLAILDRHILKNLNSIGLIDKIPGSLLRERYFEIERKMYKFAEKIDIPMSQLDLVLWYKEAGEIFK